MMTKKTAITYSESVIMICRISNSNLQFLGTGFFISSDKKVLTCAHIINPLDQIVAVFTGNINDFKPLTLQRVDYFKMELVQFDTINDIALLQLIPDIEVEIPQNIFGEGLNVYAGEEVTTIGYPFGHKGMSHKSITKGIVSSKIVTTESKKLIQFDIMVHEGSSGSPLINLEQNKIIGIVTNRFNPFSNSGTLQIGNSIVGIETNISYAIPIESALELLKN